MYKKISPSVFCLLAAAVAEAEGAAAAAADVAAPGAASLLAPSAGEEGEVAVAIDRYFAPGFSKPFRVKKSLSDCSSSLFTFTMTSISVKIV